MKIFLPLGKEASDLLQTPLIKSASSTNTTNPSIVKSQYKDYSFHFRNVLVKGGELPASSDAVDIFFNGQDFYELRSSRVQTRNTHGTGCTLASCLAAELAKGSSMLSAVMVDTSEDLLKPIKVGQSSSLIVGQHCLSNNS